MKILVVDLETTGFLPKPGKKLNQGGSIIEIGAVELNTVTGEIKEVFNSLVREPLLSKKHRSAWIFKNSSLTVEEVRNAPKAEVVYPKFQAVLDRYVYGVTAYNIKFDVNFLHSRKLRVHHKLPCIMDAATDVCKIPFPSKTVYEKYKFPTVEEAYKFLFPESNYIEAHRGCDDAKHEAKILRELIKRGSYEIK